MFHLLPLELKNIIFSSLNASDYMQLISTCKAWRKDLPETWHLSYLRGCRAISSIFNEGKNIFITGPGGCGKTFTLDRIKNWAIRRGTRYACVAPTGIAAYNINGSTIHSYFPIERKVYPSQRSKMFEKFQSIDLLIIDEISMVGCELAGEIDWILREYRRNNRPFGGIQVVFSGDFFQLPPVKDNMLYGTPLWDSLRLVRHDFVIPMRQRDDIRFFNLLNRIRCGEITPSDIELLKRRDIERLDGIPSERIIYLYFRNEDAKGKNLREFNKIPGDVVSVYADDTVAVKENHKWREIAVYDWEEIHKKTNNYTHKFQQMVHLKVQALYYLTTNIDVQKGLVNGTLCTLELIENNRLGVRYKEGFTWIYRVQKEFLFNDGTKKLIRYQYPLILGYALTVHSSQGCTFDRIVFDISRVTNRALLYVGLSRVKREKDLYLVNVNEDTIRKVLKK